MYYKHANKLKKLKLLGFEQDKPTLLSELSTESENWCRNKNCLKTVSEKVAKFSKERFGIVLCWNCQRLNEWERSIVHENE